MTHRSLLVEVWGPRYCGDDTQVLRAHIANLRRRSSPRRAALHPHGSGVGYRFAS